jgi:hypothetical protein
MNGERRATAPAALIKTVRGLVMGFLLVVVLLGEGPR